MYLSASVNASTPNLDTEYAGDIAVDRIPAKLDVLTMRP